VIITLSELIALLCQSCSDLFVLMAFFSACVAAVASTVALMAAQTASPMNAGPCGAGMVLATVREFAVLSRPAPPSIQLSAGREICQPRNFHDLLPESWG
jgi:hypothetical protein